MAPDSSATTRFATREGLALAYDLAGEGPPLLLVGGLSADRIFWGLSRPLLGGLTTLAFDNRDIGASTRASAPYGIADMARDALAVMDAAGIARAHVLGHSLGGAIAQELALLAPERVDRLVLVNTFARNTPYTREVMWLLKRLRGEIADPVTYVSALATFTLGRATLDTVPLEAIAQQALAAGPLQEMEAFARQADAAVAADTLSRLGAIVAPTLVLHSADDRIFAPALGQEVAGAISGATLEEIPRVGHCPMIEAPDAFAAAVRRFLL
ncbi:alpha/beta hydrolase [Xanthobacter sp. DSM 24535]|uniref:alpha/beta fold hydrolase n=1 Tax=Roseixanthobacter psychrophilus TaxID=3119917 RepID=UPI003729074F